MKQRIRSESAGIGLLSLKLALQFSSASVFAVAGKIWYLCLSTPKWMQGYFIGC